MEIGEKLDIFYRAAVETAREQGEAIAAESKRSCSEQLLDYENHRKKQQETRERIAAERVRKEVNREASAILLEQKREYYSAQEQKKELLFARVEEKLAAYRKTDAYVSLLSAKIKKAVEFAGGEKLTAYLDPEDEELLPRLLAAQEECPNCTVAVGNERFGGGIRAAIPAKNILLDEAFGSRLSEEREKFSFDAERAAGDEETENVSGSRG